LKLKVGYFREGVKEISESISYLVVGSKSGLVRRRLRGKIKVYQNLQEVGINKSWQSDLCNFRRYLFPIP
jgi:hypothetical protein